MGVALVTVEEELGNAIFAVYFIFNQLYITNNTNKSERSGFKVGVPCASRSLQRQKRNKDRLACSVTVRIPA